MDYLYASRYARYVFLVFLIKIDFCFFFFVNVMIQNVFCDLNDYVCVFQGNFIKSLEKIAVKLKFKKMTRYQRASITRLKK